MVVRRSWKTQPAFERVGVRPSAYFPARFLRVFSRQTFCGSPSGKGSQRSHVLAIGGGNGRRRNLRVWGRHRVFSISHAERWHLTGKPGVLAGQDIEKEVAELMAPGVKFEKYDTPDIH